MQTEEFKESIDKLFQAERTRLESIRAKIEALNDEIEWLNRAPMTIEDARANAVRWLEEQITQYDAVSRARSFFYQEGLAGERLFDLRVGPYLPEAALVNVDGNYGRLPPLRSETGGLLAALMPNEIRKNLMHLLEAAYKTIEPGPALSERPGMIEGLMKKRYQLEIEEEQLISAAETSGLDGFYRRKDINPEIVLCLVA